MCVCFPPATNQRSLYIQDYMAQAPGIGNLISPFMDMPSELPIPYSAYRAYGMPRARGASRHVEYSWIIIITEVQFTSHK